MIKKVAQVVFVLLMMLVIWQHELIGYGLRQGYGQFKIVWGARPVETVLADPHFPDSLKIKLKLVEHIRRFAIDSLGLKDTKNYRTLYDQKGEEIMWVVTACEPFALVEKLWKFPVLGELPYKGFFEKELALNEKKELEKQGWDVTLRNPGGWSTLGWFTDPILSKMLERSEGDLASLIIHEMVHATIFVKDSVDFNENLASFIGDRGAELFLIHYFGNDSDEYRKYRLEEEELSAYVGHVLRGCNYLDSVYKAIQNLPLKQKEQEKENAIRKIMLASDSLTFTTFNRPSDVYKDQLPNNAYFMSYLRYRSKQDLFSEELKNRFGGNLKNYIRHLSQEHPFL